MLGYIFCWHLERRVAQTVDTFFSDYDEVRPSAAIAPVGGCGDAGYWFEYRKGSAGGGGEGPVALIKTPVSPKVSLRVVSKWKSKYCRPCPRPWMRRAPLLPRPSEILRNSPPFCLSDPIERTELFIEIGIFCENGYWGKETRSWPCLRGRMSRLEWPWLLISPQKLPVISSQIACVRRFYLNYDYTRWILCQQMSVTVGYWRKIKRQKNHPWIYGNRLDIRGIFSDVTEREGNNNRKYRRHTRRYSSWGGEGGRISHDDPREKKHDPREGHNRRP